MRIIHACGMTEIARDIVMSPGFAEQCALGADGRRADPVRFQDGGQRHHPRAPAGRQRGRLHARRSLRCRPCAQALGNTRSAAAMELWGDRLAGAVVAIGNAPTALFRLLEMLDAGAPPPAAVIGLPVGFVGAMESKEALAADGARAVPDRARPQGRQRHGGGGRQRAGERGGMTCLDTLAGTAPGGTLYGIGVGPGDVRYLTLRAAGLVRAVDVVAYFAKKRPARQCAPHRGAASGRGPEEMRLEYPVTDEMPAEQPGLPAEDRRASIARRPTRWRRCCGKASRSACWPRAIRSSTAPSCICGAASALISQQYDG